MVAMDSDKEARDIATTRAEHALELKSYQNLQKFL